MPSRRFRITPLTALIILLCVSACRHGRHDAQLVSVDSLLQDSPDSAFAVLSRMEIPQSRQDRMYYYMLMADAANSCYETLPSDSIMAEVVDYFDSRGTAHEQLRAHYLLGCAYRDAGEAPHALDCFHDAVACADTTAADCDWRILSRVHAQSAELFLNQGAPVMAIQSMQDAEHCAWFACDTLAALISSERRSIAYAAMGMRDSAIRINANAVREYRKYGYSRNAMMDQSANILYLLEKGEYQKAKSIMDEYEKDGYFFDEDKNIRQGLEIYYYEKGLYYLHEAMLDSAEHYFRKEMCKGYSLNDKEAAANGLYQLYRQKGQSDSVAKYAQLCYAYCDSTAQMHHVEIMTRMQSMYQYERFRKQAQESLMQSTLLQRKLFFSVFLIVVLVVVGIRFHRHSKQREKAMYLRLVALEKDKTLEEIWEKEQQLLHSPIVDAFRKYAIKGHLPANKEWDTLWTSSCESLPAFMSFISSSDNSLRIEEQYICLLIRLRFSPKEISLMTLMSLQSVSNIRKRLLKKLFKIEEGSPKDFDKLLQEMH